MQRSLSDLSDKIEMRVLSDNTGDAVKDLAQGVDKLIKQMRAEQKVVREWADEQAQQQHELATALRQITDRAKLVVHEEKVAMALARSRNRGGVANYWPGFVDVLSTLLLVVIFLMSLFMLTNYFITTQTSGKDTLLSRLNTQLSQLTDCWRSSARRSSRSKTVSPRCKRR